MHCLMKVQHLLTQQTLKNVEHDRQLAPPLVLNEGNAAELKVQCKVNSILPYILNEKTASNVCTPSNYDR